MKCNAFGTKSVNFKRCDELTSQSHDTLIWGEVIHKTKRKEKSMMSMKWRLRKRFQIMTSKETMRQYFQNQNEKSEEVWKNEMSWKYQKYYLTTTIVLPIKLKNWKERASYGDQIEFSKRRLSTTLQIGWERMDICWRTMRKNFRKWDSSEIINYTTRRQLLWWERRMKMAKGWNFRKCGDYRPLHLETGMNRY